ncbi:MAG: TerC family protein [Phycisphaerales bacterium]
MNGWPWLILLLAVCGLSAADLLILNRKPGVQRASSALGWFSFYLLLAVGFNAVVFVAYSHHWIGLGTAGGQETRSGTEASLEFLSALVLDLALDLDMVFVFSAVFAHFKTPPKHQRRVLMYGVVVTQLVQGPLIFLIGSGLAVPGLGRAIRLVLAMLLVLAALRMIVVRRQSFDPAENPLYGLLKRFLPISESFEGDAITTRVAGRMSFTPLIFTLLVLTTAELVFSLDSIPATFAVSSDPLIIFAANGFGLLCMRSLYFAIKDAAPSLRYIKVGLALTLAHCAFAISLPRAHQLPPEVFLAVIGTAVGLGLWLAGYYGKPGSGSEPDAGVSPLGHDADRFARSALKHSKKIIVLLVGVSMVVVGIVMIVAPGPAVIVIPAGLALLATEFIWAKRLLDKYRTHAAEFSRRAGDAIVTKPRPWLVLPVLAAVGAVVLVATQFWRPKLVFLAGTPVFAFLGMWVFTTLRKTIELRRKAASPGGTEGQNPENR